ncbi:SNF2 family N-terminal domain-containing protein [Stachybotrys elegans]|uniref:SNF2 family N-terminal domain-containing protein n=1 Tax=Stachybotrys elegans TaxID=80388 RepID=A0A8K0T3H6_9HYPO|nr:SNF2 family N-terminal domain-containing protein [Stachybotrys elegans]
MGSSDHGQPAKRQRLDETWQRQTAAQCHYLTPLHLALGSHAPGAQPAPSHGSMTFHRDSATTTPFIGRLEPPRPPQTPANAFASHSFHTDRVGFGFGFGSSLVTQQPYQPPQWQPKPGFEQNPMVVEDLLARGPDHAQGTLYGANVTSNLAVSEATPLEQLVCFGMVSGLSGTCEGRIGQAIPKGSLVKMESAERFFLVDHKDVRGRLHADHGQMMQGLLDDKTLTLFVTCTFNTIEQKMRNSAKSSAVTPCSLDIVVYGPSDLYEEIGSWFEEYDIFLQDPRTCHLDRRYTNPHRLSSIDASQCPLLSEVVSKSSTVMQLSEIAQGPDSLSTLSVTQDLEEAPQPAAVRTALKRHQKQALSFMLSREDGWGFYQQRPDIWEIVDTTQTRQYLNAVSGVSQPEEPAAFAGGIVADPMGLGKTLTMISLVTTDMEREEPLPSSLDMEIEKVQIMATLIIVPPPLLGTWEHELDTHVVPGAMQHRRHHGKTRMRGKLDLEGIHVVLTTYHTVSAEWGSDSSGESSVLFSIKWNRIILDEAHLVRNAKSRMAKAVCSLDAKARWAVTGTPIQNHLPDFAALLQFIRVYPYDDPRYFDSDIASLWKFGEEAEAVERLKRLSRHILLRRPKDTIDLPARHDLLCPVDFSRDEKTVYNKIRTQTIKKLDESLYDQSGSYKASSYMNALQQIESLRLFCDLGVQFQAHHAQRETENLEITPDNWSVMTAQRAFSIQQEMHSIFCLQCDSAFEPSQSSLEADDALPQFAHFSSCLRFACANCTNKLNRHNQLFDCGHQPSCPTALVSLSNNTMDDASSLPDLGLDYSSDTLSSKVQTLIRDIMSRPPHEKCIVFSTWRLTLNMVQKGLEEARIPCVRFDGKVPQRDRQPLVERFNTDPGLRVMLLTLSCGAVGLTLTAANRAYLMEPHWNPTLEDQALARVHRLGQTKEVTTIRFYIRDSFEEKVMELQESKRSLAGVLLSPHEGGQADDSKQGELQVRECFSLFP